MPEAPRADLASQKKKEKSKSNTSFLVESIVLLFFLLATLAIFVQIFASSVTKSYNASQLTSATGIAQKAAEEFSANPEAVALGKTVGAGVAAKGSGSFDVTCNVTKQAQTAGTLYEAVITVSEDGKEVYTLNATRYVQGGAS